MKQKLPAQCVLALVLVLGGLSETFAFVCLVRIESATGEIDQIVPLNDGTHLIGAVNGLFRFDDGRLMRVHSDMATGDIDEIVPLDDGAYLIDAGNGLFRFDDGRLMPVDSDMAIDIIWQIVPLEDSTALVKTGNGLFRIDGGRLLRVDSDLATGEIEQIVPLDDGTALVGAGNGLFRLDDGRMMPVDSDMATDRIVGVAPLGNGTALVGAVNGLFWLAGGRLLRVEPDMETPALWRVVPLDDGTVLLYDVIYGLFWIDDARLARVESGMAILGIVALDDGTALVGATNGLFRFNDGRLTRVDSDMAAGVIWQIVPLDDGTHLINATNGLFRFDDGRQTRIDSDITDSHIATRFILGIFPLDDGTHLVGATNGLFRLDGGQLLRVGSDMATGEIDQIAPLDDGTRLIGTDNGLFQYVPQKPWDLLQKKTREDARADQRIRFVWHLTHPCHEVLVREHPALFRVVPDGQSPVPAVIKHAGSEVPANAFAVEGTLPIDAESGDTLKATLEYRLEPESNDWIKLTESVTTVRVEWGFGDYLGHLAEVLWLPALVVWIVVFSVLAFAARYSARAWGIIGDPIWGRFGLWLWAWMRLSSGLQRIFLARWFDEVRKQLTSEDYLSVPLKDPQNETIDSCALVSELSPNRRIWLQGAVGMGKTVLVNEVNAQYFCDSEATTLGHAYKQHGYVPLYIRLRNFEDIPVPDKPEEWLFDLAQRVLASQWLRIDDRRLLRGMLTSGYFVLILDGANEVDDHGAIMHFAHSHPEVGLLVTSQVDPDDRTAPFDIWRLPPDIREATERLLKLYLGPERGQKTFQAIRSSVRDDVRSGYDVRLLADLVDGGTAPDELPRSRLGLYEAMLDAVEKQPTPGAGHVVPDLCKTAWQCWSEGRRDLIPGGNKEADENIKTALLESLRVEGVRIVRTVGGKSYEFRHDQMRGYLAARWAAHYEFTPINLFEANPGIWRLGRVDQKVVWEFFAELVALETGVMVLKWARKEEERTLLQVALNDVAERDGWPGTN